jgi:sec-independent protein translocase protein TatA
MGSLGPLEIIAIVLVILLLFGYKKLPAASRSLGQSLRIFKGEMKGMKGDDAAAKDAATVTPVRAELAAPLPKDADLTAHLQDEARAAEIRAAELRARADRSGTVDGPH